MQLIGQVLQETYRIERLLGRGGKGEVYLAAHLRLPRRFAVKVLFPHNAYKREEVLRFRREAEVVSALGHPNIIEVIDFNHTPWGAPYIVMELLEGEDLSARLQRVGRLGLEPVGLVLKQVCSALQAAHQRGVIHRDLKPSNIFLCRKGEHVDWVKVVDFGLSKVWGAAVAVTDGRLAIGTPRYMAPEQAVGRSSEADARTDVFSLGAIMFRMLTGQLPFMGDTIQALLNNIVFVDPPLITEVVEDLPRDVAQVVDRALKKRPEDRYQSMEQLWSAFEETAGVNIASVASMAVRGAALPQPPESAGGDQASGPTDPHPEHSATFTHATGELVTAEEAATRLHQPERRRAERRARRMTGLLVVVTAAVVATVGIWIGLRLIDTDAPAPAAARGVAVAPADAEPADLATVAGESGDAGVSRPVDLTVGQRVRLRTRPDARAAAHRERSQRHKRAPRTGKLHVVTRSGGGLLWAEVYLDGKKQGASPVLKRLPAGSHLVVVQRPGYRSVSRRVRVRPGRTVKVILDLERK